MRQSAPFLADDLDSLADLFDTVDAVVPMVDVHEGNHDSNVIAVRHDVDDNSGSWQAALGFARWEYERGYRSTYFLLHSASYWGQPGFWPDVRSIIELGHEIGLHVNGIATAIRTGRDPHEIVSEALRELRRETGLTTIGEVAHGDELCSQYRFVNDEMFSECVRPDYGAPDRTVASVQLEPRPLADFGLLYDSNRLPRKFYASDSGGDWSQPWIHTVQQGISSEGQLHLLIHPDWWTEAF